MKKLVLLSAGLFLITFAIVAKAEDKSQAVVNEFNNLVAKTMVEYMENEWVVVQGSKEYLKFAWELLVNVRLYDVPSIIDIRDMSGSEYMKIAEEAENKKDEADKERGKWFKFGFEIIGIGVKVEEINSFFKYYSGIVSGKGRSKKGEVYNTKEEAINSPTPDLTTAKFEDFELKYEYKGGRWKFVSFTSGDGQEYTAKEIRQEHCYPVVNGVVFEFWLPDKRF